MYLTRMHLNPNRRQTKRFLLNPQAMHAAVESSFPPGLAGKRNLWRLDSGPQQTNLLILSERIPSLEHIQEQAGWANEKTWESRDYEPLLARIVKGQRYGFRLTANPTHTETGPDGSKKVKAHVSVRHQIDWLAKKAPGIGVQLFLPGSPEATDHPSWETGVVRRETMRFRRDGARVTIAEATFQGVLQVEDAGDLRHALVNGIGRAKAYGCGLLTLAPAVTD